MITSRATLLLFSILHGPQNDSAAVSPDAVSLKHSANPPTSSSSRSERRIHLCLVARRQADVVCRKTTPHVFRVWHALGIEITGRANLQITTRCDQRTRTGKNCGYFTHLRGAAPAGETSPSFSSSTSLVPCVSTTTGAGQEQTSSPELTAWSEKWTQVTELAADRPHAATHTDLVACCTRVVAERAEQHDFQAKAQERSEPRQQRR